MDKIGVCSQVTEDCKGNCYHAEPHVIDSSCDGRCIRKGQIKVDCISTNALIVNEDFESQDGDFGTWKNPKDTKVEGTLSYSYSNGWVSLVDKWSSDLSKVEVGDWIATIAWGWCRVKRISSFGSYPIQVNRHSSYTFDGKNAPRDKAPSAFIIPPQWLLEIIGPKPCEFSKGDKVMVRNCGDSKWYPRYFSHQDRDFYCCFADGSTEWSNSGEMVQWEQCRKPTEEELK